MMVFKAKKIYQVKANGIVRRLNRLRQPITTHGTIYKANFSKEEKAEKKFNELKKDYRVDDVQIDEVDTSKGESYTSGRQLSSGVYYTKPRQVSYYPQSAKKTIKKWSSTFIDDKDWRDK